MQFESSDWLNHYDTLAIILCSPNMSTVRVCSKLKTRWKSVVFTNKVGKNFRYFRGVFNKTVIPLALVGYEMIIASHCPTDPRGIIANYKLPCQFEFMLNHVPYSVLRARKKLHVYLAFWASSTRIARLTVVLSDLKQGRRRQQWKCR